MSRETQDSREPSAQRSEAPKGKKPLLDRRWPWIAAAVVLAIAFVLTLVDFRAGLEGRPEGTVDDIASLSEREDLNVLFILIDTLRADHLGSYGYERDTSPVLDRLAESGVRFDRHLAQSSWTKCSMASMWTGMYPKRIGVTRYDEMVPEDATMPAEILRAAGFHTVGIYRNGWVAPTFGFHQGFDVYTRPAPRPPNPRVRAENPTIGVEGTDEDTVGSALEFLRIHGDERWFLYLHLMDVHEYLYDEGTALFGGRYSDVYDNSIRWVDRVIGVLMAHLIDQGLARKTLVVITSDHGEALGERGYEGHARNVFRETTEVPFILSFPFRLEPGVVVSARTRNVDIWPTVLDLLGLEAPAGIDGESVVPDLLASARGEAPAAPARTAIAHLDQHWGQVNLDPLQTVAVAQGGLRYVRLEEYGVETERLFDAERDARELKNVAEQEASEVERLGAIADAYLETEPALGAAPQREISELELNQLRALGYALP